MPASTSQSRDREILAATVGEPTVLDGPITLAEADPAWPERFQDEAARIRGALGPRALSVEHTGSTSVPGLAAKPIIDIILEVTDPADEDSYVPALVAAGYVLAIREPDWHQHRLLVRRRDLGHAQDVNVHVLAPGCVETQRQVTFRDHLRRHPDDRQAYEATKRALAAQRWKYVQHYADAKTQIIEAILARAEAPSRESGTTA